MARESRVGRVLDVLTVALVAAAVGLLVLQRLDARAAAERARAAVSSVASHAPAAGQQLASVEVSDPGGAHRLLFGPDDEQRRLVYLFRSDCPACAAQKPDWVELAEIARRNGWSVEALSSEVLSRWVRDYLPAPAHVYRIESQAEAADRLGITVVPATILVGRAGRVISFHVGRMGDAQRDSLRLLLARPPVDPATPPTRSAR